MAKKAAIDLNIKMAGSKKKAGKQSKLNIDSPTMEVNNPEFNSSKKASKNNPQTIDVPAVDVCIKMAQEIESLKAELKIYETEIVTVADEKKDLEKAKGTFIKTVDVQGTNNKMQIQFKDAYSKMDESMRQPLKDIFKDKYPTMFEEITERTVDPDKDKIKELKKILGKRYDEFIITDEAVKPTKEFSYNHFLLANSLEKDQKETVQKILDACANRPTVKYPK